MSDDDLDSFMERGNVGIMKRRDVGFDSSKKKRKLASNANKLGTPIHSHYLTRQNNPERTYFERNIY